VETSLDACKAFFEALPEAYPDENLFNAQVFCCSAMRGPTKTRLYMEAVREGVVAVMNYSIIGFGS
jgi:hypothetical protein